ncbi:glycosyltransferase family 9 protein [Inquilinus sp. CA228]|uniref:glycosyltransferase family 9 protein n=1 Tax=Inquilinus sp. CA228 TaxID=3455609 RepID=UPI003F8D825D
MAGVVTVLKPDHLGDLVLSVPAIRAIQASGREVRLHVAPSSEALARYLFPDIAHIRTVEFQHLSRAPVAPPDLADLIEDSRRSDVLICLRSDQVIETMLKDLSLGCLAPSRNPLVHETGNQRMLLEPVIGSYSRTRHFSGEPIRIGQVRRHVALCISAGFPTNRWPNLHWLSLATLLGSKGVFITLVGGPSERGDLALLSRLLRGIPHRVVEGGRDFGRFLHALEEVDLVVASDSGTAHICSLTKPICSLFGPSPWRRYAPFGRNNLLMTRDEVCSPCAQFSSRVVNGCASRECMTSWSPTAVAQFVLDLDPAPLVRSGIRIETGVSHQHP